MKQVTGGWAILEMGMFRGFFLGRDLADRMATLLRDGKEEPENRDDYTVVPCALHGELVPWGPER